MLELEISVLQKAADNSVVETIDVTGDVTGSGTSQITILHLQI